MKKHAIGIILGFLVALLILGTASATIQFTTVIGSQNPSSSGIAQDLASSQYVTQAIGQKYGSGASFTSVIDTELSSTAKQNNMMNIIVFGGPRANSITQELVNSGKSKVNWATSEGQIEIIPNAWGPNTAKVFIVAGKDRTATQAACKEFANQIKAGTVAFVGSTPTPPVTDKYTIQSSAGTGGTISPLGTVSVNAGSSQTFTITPDDDYEIDDVVVDGVSQGAKSSYTFYNVNMYHYINAYFTQVEEEYIIRAYAGSGGTIYPSGSVTVDSGDSITFYITPNTGMKISDVTVDGDSVGTPDHYEFDDVDDEHTIRAYFEVI